MEMCEACFSLFHQCQRFMFQICPNSFLNLIMAFDLSLILAVQWSIGHYKSTTITPKKKCTTVHYVTRYIQHF